MIEINKTPFLTAYVKQGDALFIAVSFKDIYGHDDDKSSATASCLYWNSPDMSGGANGSFGVDNADSANGNFVITIPSVTTTGSYYSKFTLVESSNPHTFFEMRVDVTDQHGKNPATDLDSNNKNIVINAKNNQIVINHRGAVIADSGLSAQVTANTNNLAALRESYEFLSDHGVTGDGVTNDTANFLLARAAAAANNKILVGWPGATFLIDGIEFSNTGELPAGVDMRGATIKCSGINTPANNSLIYIQNPHAIRDWFFFRRCFIDADDAINHGLKVHGGQNFEIENITISGGLSDGSVFEAEPGYGIYDMSVRNFVSSYNAGRGLTNVSINNGTSYHSASNEFKNIRVMNNLSDGAHFDYANGKLSTFRTELNNGYGLSVDHVRALKWSGGYSEHNHENLAQGGVSDATADSLAVCTADSSGVTCSGFRDIGTFDDSLAVAAGNRNFIFLRTAGNFDVDSLGNVSTGSVRVDSTGGFMIGAGTMTANAYGGNDQLKIRAGGNNAITIPSANVEGKSTPLFKFLKNGSPVNRALNLWEGVKTESAQNYEVQVEDAYHELTELDYNGTATYNFPDSSVTPLPLHVFTSFKKTGTGSLTVTKTSGSDTFTYGPGEGLVSPGQNATMGWIQTSLGVFHVVGGEP